jgi:hypothetical protein
MFKSFCVLVSLLVVSPLIGAEIFKCTHEGKTVYQNFECDVDSIGSSATAVAPSEETPPAASAPVQRTTSQVAAAKSSVPGLEPRIGMTLKQMKNSAWGQPIDVVKEEVVEGWTQTWYWDLEKKRTVVFDVRGVVSEITR